MAGLPSNLARFPAHVGSTFSSSSGNIQLDERLTLELEKLQDVLLPELLGALRRYFETRTCMTNGQTNDDEFLDIVRPARNKLLTVRPVIANMISESHQVVSTSLVEKTAMVAKLEIQYESFNRVLAADPLNDVQLMFELRCLQAMLGCLLEIWKPERRELHVVFSDDTQTMEELPQFLVDEDMYRGGNIKVSINLCTLISSQYANLLRSKEHSDVTFSINETLIPAHRIILAAHSEYFEKLLFGNLSEAQSFGRPIELKDVSLSSFKLLLCFAYTGCIELHDSKLEGVLELLETADRFCFVHLKDALAQQLSKVINVSSVLPVFVLADHLDLKELCRSCLSFADLHAPVILKEDCILSLPQETLITLISRDSFIVDELSIYNCIEKWMTHNSVTHDNSQFLLQCVRLTEIPPDKLLDLAHPHGKFTEGQVIHALRVQMKKLVGEKRPRGLCVFDKNLFDSVDSTTIIGTVNWRLADIIGPSTGLPPPPPFTGVLHVPQTRGGFPPMFRGGRGQTSARPSQSMIYFGSPKHPLNQIILCSQLGMRQNQTPLTFTVNLTGGVHLINYISFICYPDKVPVTKNSGVSYIIEISRTGDVDSWLTLFDYSRYFCYGKQELRFPKQALQFIRISIVATSSQAEAVTVRLCSCMLETTPLIRTVFCYNSGVIAPLDYYKPKVFQTFETLISQEYACQVTVNFDTPLSITLARFRLTLSTSDLIPLPSTVSGLLLWGIDGHILEDKKHNFDINQQISFEFNGENVVSVLVIKLEQIAVNCVLNDLEVLCKRQ